MSARGRPARRRVLFALAMWWWLSLGFPLAYHKGQRGPVVDWIGATLSVHRDHVVARCMRSKAATFGRDCSSVARHALVRSVKLRALAGFGSWAAGIVPQVRWAVAVLWAAFRCPRPDGYVFTRQVRHALRWLIALFADGGGATLQRSIPVRPCTAGSITCDASPWGLGAILLLMTPQGLTPVAWFAIPLDPAIVRRLSARVGDCRWQSVWELLCIAVALRAWALHFCGGTAALRVKSDSRAALGAALRLASKAPTMNQIAAEIALDTALGGISVTLAEHVRAELNVEADALSRIYEPGAGYTVPAALQGVPRVAPAPFQWRVDALQKS